MRSLIAGLVLTCSLFAQGDVAGKWRGSIFTEMAQQTEGKIPAYLILEQSNGKITGSAGGSETDLFKIKEAKLEGDKLTIEVSPKDTSTLRFTFTLKQDQLEGGVEENGRPIGTAKLTRY